MPAPVLNLQPLLPLLAGLPLLVRTASIQQALVGPGAQGVPIAPPMFFRFAEKPMVGWVEL